MWNPLTVFSRPLITGISMTSIVGLAYFTVAFGDLPGTRQSSIVNPQPAQSTLLATTPVSRNITVYRSPSCGCCGGWINHLKQNGFTVNDVKTDDVASVKNQHHLPDKLASCHTAVIDGYVVEGHVPVREINKLLTQKPNIAGIAVPGMPIGTPGMESGDRKDPFDVLSFTHSGEVSVFAEYR